jgi:hypothetical protein
MKPVPKRRAARLAWTAIAAGLALSAAAVASSATVMKNPLYGDPTHPDLSGMWNPEYAYFGPPIGDGAGPPGPPPGAPRAGPPAAAAPAGARADALAGARGGAPAGARADAPAGAAPGAGGPPAGRPPAMMYRPPMPQLTPAYAKKYAEWRKKFETGEQDPDTVTRCLAFGLARFGTMPMEIIQTPGQITMNLGVLHDIRRIYMDGIGHTTGADPSFNGDSVGHWDGETLVVETNNVRAGTLDRDGVPYSDKLTAVERIRRVSPTRLEIETTLTDPEAFVVPFTIKRAYVPMPPGSRFEEYLCENNRDL